MPEANEQDIRDMLSGLDNVTSDTIALYLNDAKSRIVAQGVGTTHVRFGECQRFLTAHLMSNDNVGNSNIESESVSDVSISYGKNQEALGGQYGSSWEREYRRVLNQILGMSDICL